MRKLYSDVVIIGGGISGLSAAYFLHDFRKDLKITLVEGTDRFGGKIRTEPLGELIGEAGPDTFVLGYPAMSTLLEKTGLEKDIIKPFPNKAYIWTRGGLHPIPEGLVMGFPSTKVGPLINSGILSFSELIRCSMDIFLPKTKIDGDIGIGELAEKRFGRGLKESIVDPLIGGIMACSSDRLSTKEVMPALFKAAQENRSLILAMRNSTRNNKAKRAGSVSFMKGLSYMTDKIVEKLEDVEIIKGENVVSLVMNDGQFLLDTEKSEIEGKSVVLAVPSFSSAKILESNFPEVSAKLSGITYTSVAIVILAYRRDDFNPPFNSSGFLVSPREGKLMTASTWLTMKWEYAKSDDYFLVRCFVGTPDDVRWEDMTDEELVGKLNSELSEVVRISGSPVKTKVIRWLNALPQYKVGHSDIVKEAESKLPVGLYLTGAAYHGVGIPACVTDAFNVAKKISEKI